MRGSWGTIVGGVLGVVGSVVWAVNLAIYQQLMEPTGFYVTDTGALYPNNAENNTYWPREMRQAALLLALAAVIVIGRASRRAFVAAATVGLAWLAADLWLDRIDIEGRPAAAWLAAAGCGAVAGAAVFSRGGRPLDTGRYLAAGTIAVLAWAPTLITTPWERPGSADEAAIENAVTVMSIVLAVGFVAAAVSLVWPAMTTARWRWPVPIGAAVTVAALVLIITDDTPFNFSLVLPALSIVVIAAARDVPVIWLLVVGGAGVVLSGVLILLIFVTTMVTMGPIMTDIAGNPPVHGADFDTAVALPYAAFGLTLAAVSHWLTRTAAPAPAPVEA